MSHVTEKNKYRILLASASPRRSILLSQLGLSVDICPVNICEDIYPDEKPQDAVKRLAKEKGMELQATIKRQWDFIIAADTIVCVNSKILGKPKNSQEAKKMLESLSGKTHNVFTGLALLKNGWQKPITSCENTRVTFCKLSKDNISSYIATGEPLGKAGAYAIQGKGAAFISKINGCYYNVVGLPIYRLRMLLLRACYDITKVF